MIRQCTKCGSNTRIMVQLTVVIDSEHEGNLTKEVLLSENTIIYSANWDSMDVICNKCGHVDAFFGLYVKRLKQEVEQLKEVVAKYESN